MVEPAWLLIADEAPERLFSEVLPWILLLIGLVVVLGLVIYAARRLLHGGGTDVGGGFTLGDLRDLHAAGEITDEEYERARSRMIDRVRGTAEESGSGGSAGSVRKQVSEAGSASEVADSAPETPDSNGPSDDNSQEEGPERSGGHGA